MGAIIPSSRKSNDSTTQQLLLRCINTKLLIKSETSSPWSSTASQMPSQPLVIALTGAATAWKGASSPTSCTTSRTKTPSPYLSNSSLVDTIETLLASALSMMEHLSSEGGVSPLASVLPWVQWSNKLAREMYVKCTLQQLNLQYPSDSNDL